MRFGKPLPGQQPQAQRLNLRQSQIRPAEADAPNQLRPPQSGGGDDFDSNLPLAEGQVAFDDTDGHDHTGADDTGKQISHVNLTNVTADQHHAQSHVLATNTALGADHTMSGATAGHVLRATGATTATFSQLQHSELGGVTADQHHAQAHSLTGADHTLSGATAGHILAATSATAFALQAPGTQVIQAGTTKPAATSVPDGTLYLDTDDNGGTLYRSNGTSWVQCGAAVTATGGTTGQMFVGTWVRSNIGGLTTSATKDRLASAWFFGASQAFPESVGRTGTLTLVVATLNSAIAGGGSVELEIFKDTGSGLTATAVTATISNGEDSKEATISHAVNAGDLVEVRANRSGTVGAADMSVKLYLTPS